MAEFTSARASAPLCITAGGLAIAVALSALHAAMAQTASPVPRLALWKVTDYPTTIFAEVDNLPAGQAGTVDFSVAGKSIGTAPLSTAGAGQATIAAGNGHVCVITPETRVKCWGKNDKGQLGNGTTSTTIVQASAATEVKVGATALTGVLAIAAGDNHTCAVMASDRSAKCWGANDKGQLGNGTTTSSSAPVDVKSSPTVATALATVVSITAGATHTCALLEGRASRLQCWGSDKATQIGDGDTDATDVGYSIRVGITGKAGGVGYWRRPKDPMTTTPVPVAFSLVGAARAFAITAGGDGTCTHDYFGAQGVTCWGRHSYKLVAETGKDPEWTNDLIVTSDRDPTKGSSFLPTRVASVALSQKHVCAVKPDGIVSCGGFDGKTIDVPLAAPEGARLTVRRARPLALTANGSGSVYCALLDDRVSCWALTGDTAPPAVTAAFDLQISGARLSDGIAIGLGNSTGADGTEVCVVRRSGAVACGALTSSASGVASKRSITETGVTAIRRARASLHSTAVASTPATATVTAGTTSLTGTR